MRLTLQPLEVNEVGYYVAHRWSVAGGKNPPPFTSEAIASLAKWSKGIPRVINSICDNALLDAFADTAPLVTVDHIHCAVRDLRLASAESIPTSPPVTPLAVTVATPRVRPIELRTLERYQARPARESIVTRWASRLGLA